MFAASRPIYPVAGIRNIEALAIQIGRAHV